MFYKHFTGVTYTTGIKNLANEKSSYWLIDAIASHVCSNPKFKKRCSVDQMFDDMQIWILEKTQKNQARLFCVADTIQEELNNPTCEQKIPFTDFEFEGNDIKFYCAKNILDGKKYYTIMLPNEY